MTLKDQVSNAIHICMTSFKCSDCPYNFDEQGMVRDRKECIKLLLKDFDFMMDDMENVIKLLEEENEHKSGE